MTNEAKTQEQHIVDHINAVVYNIRSKTDEEITEALNVLEELLEINVGMYAEKGYPTDAQTVFRMAGAVAILKAEQKRRNK